MSAKEARHASQQGASANRHRHSDQSDREHCFQEIERLLRENEDLRRKVAEREKQVADAEKQIADLERQLAARKKNSTNSSKPPSSDGLAGDQRPRGRKHKSKRKPGAQPGDTTNWLQCGSQSTNWRDGFDGTSGSVSGYGGTTAPGGSTRYAGWGFIPGYSRQCGRAGGLGAWRRLRP
jgi:hypothetical protein